MIKKLIIILVFLTVLALNGCDFLGLPYSQSFTSHDIRVSNSSSQEIYVEYVAESRIIDTTSNQTLVDFVLIDSSLIIPKSDFAILFERQFDEHQRYGLEYAHIKNLITKLKIYRIQGNDTLMAYPDLLDENQWKYFNNDPLPFSDYLHSYVLLIGDEDFE